MFNRDLLRRSAETAMGKRVYVNVQANHLRNGNVVPKIVQLKDGREWKIQKVLYSCESTDEETEGIRYTVLIAGAEKYIYELNGRWYVISAEGGGI